MTNTQTTSQQLSPSEAAAILRWYISAGVDVSTGESPVDRTIAPPVMAQQNLIPETNHRSTANSFSQGFSHPPSHQTSTQVTQQPKTSVNITPQLRTPDVSLAKSLPELHDLIDNFDCPLRRMATQTVLGRGPENPRLMVIGEAPDADEDRSGIPFTGQIGCLFDKMLASINLPRDEIYISNIIPWRPPGNRTPTQEEIRLCLPFIYRTIELIRPDTLLLMGGSAAHAILNCHNGITRLRGVWNTFDKENMDLSIPVLATFHPNYLLRQPKQKSLAWRDLLSLKKHLISK